MAKAMKQPDWKAMFEKMSNTRYSPESLYAMFQEAREKAIASRLKTQEWEAPDEGPAGDPVHWETVWQAVRGEG